MLGPQLNKNNYSFSTRDSLGIESVAASMSADVCPIVNTVTPRAFYWPFLVWIYYDYYNYSGITEISDKSFSAYLKRQDYYFVMASLLVKGDETNLVGKAKAGIDISKGDGPYPFNKDYFQHRLGGMQYYNAGCLTMRFIGNRDKEGNTYTVARLTDIGEELAISFRDVIKDTEYYKSYRLNDKPVPKEVLIEYGKVISLNMKGFDKTKDLLKKRLINANPPLRKCAAYLKYLYDEHDIKDLRLDLARKIFFDHLSDDNSEVQVPEELIGVVKAWEIIIGRMYFTLGLEMVWKPMLELIKEPMSASDWILTMLDYSNYTWDICQPLESVLSDCKFDFAEREKLINDVRLRKNPKGALEDGIKIMLSIYNWLKEHPAKDNEQNLLYYGSENGSIPLSEFERTVDDYLMVSIKDFMIFVMRSWLIEQHYLTAFEKMLYDVDGFFYAIVDGKYICTHDFKIDYQGNRMLQLFQVMKDLDMF